MADLTVEETAIPGLLVLHLPVHGDSRGWFKENWQREKMTALGLPDFGPVQNNVSFNDAAGVTRGVHAEPWDKLVSVVTGRIFGAWVDLREGDSFGRSVTLELGPETTVFVPRGVGNSYQTLADDTAYSYLVNAHWSAQARDSYVFVNLADPEVGIDWPIALEDAELSEADRKHPLLADVEPMAPRRALVLGAGGQVGQALAARLSRLPRGHPERGRPRRPPPRARRRLGRLRRRLQRRGVHGGRRGRDRGGASPGLGRSNATGAGRLAAIARRHGLTLVHFSTDYVFDGTREVHDEDEPFSPLGVYGQSKAAGDALVATVPRHYVLRTSWVVGDGGNFIATMASLADRGVSPSVIDDQVGRLSFADDLARAATHLVTSEAEPGTYNVQLFRARR